MSGTALSVVMVKNVQRLLKSSKVVCKNNNNNVWFQKIFIPPPRRELKIPEGWGGGVKSPGKSRGEGVEWINYFPEGQLRFIPM